MFDLNQSIKADPDQLREGVSLLRRIAEALERLSPVIPAAPPIFDGKQTTAADIRVADPAISNEIELIKDRFAQATKTTVNSEAFWQEMYEAEEYIAKTEGEEFVEQLEWNKYGRLFNREAYHQRQIAKERRERDEAKKGKSDGTGKQESTSDADAAANISI